MRVHARTVGAGLALRTAGDFRPKGDARAGAAGKAMAPPPPDAITGVYRQAAQDGAVRAYMGFSYIKYSLASIRLFYYRTEVLRWQVPLNILFYYRDKVHVPQVPRLYGILVGYGSESVTTLYSDFLWKIPRARNPRGTRARTKV